MGIVGVESTSDAKSQLVLEICSMSTTPINACSHRHRFNSPVNSHFIDWYRLLGVTEDAGLELIKRRYHKLALQLHPDKNKHPKAEVAFKLVSEAYSCLSDNVRRRAFNSERWKYSCIECNRIPYSNANSQESQPSSRFKAQDPMNCSKCGRVVQVLKLKDMRNRFKEEIRVIENCLRVNSLSRRESPVFNPSNNHCQSVRETPIFEPSKYIFDGYPHLRSQIYKKSESLQRGRGRGSYHSPIFENGSAKEIFTGMLKTKSVCINS